MKKLLKIGDYVVLKGQRKGRYHLEGGVLVHIEGIAASVVCDDKQWVMPLEDLEHFSLEYKTPRGNELVPIEGGIPVLR